MKRMVTTGLVVVGLLAASSALALNTKSNQSVPQRISPTASTALFQCDNDGPLSAYYQDDGYAYGNRFNFGAATQLSSVQFVHYGFGFPGPYSYDLEVWDPASCTFVASVNNLVAADAAGDVIVEDLDLCAANIFLTGSMIVAIDANSCAAPDDCYPDVLFDNQYNNACPWVVGPLSGPAACEGLVSPSAGAFLFRASTAGCNPTSTQRGSWGQLKSIYR